MAAHPECPACHYQGATLPFNGDDQVQCPRCERVYALAAVESSLSAADAVSNADSNMDDDLQVSCNGADVNEAHAEAITPNGTEEAQMAPRISKTIRPPETCRFPTMRKMKPPTSPTKTGMTTRPTRMNLAPAASFGCAAPTAPPWSN